MGNETIPQLDDPAAEAFQLRLEIAELRDDLRDVEADRDAYRMLAKEAVHLVYATQRRLDRASNAVIDLRQALRGARNEQAAAA